MFLTDEQGARIEPYLRVEKQGRRGRPRRDLRAVFEAILFLLCTGRQGKYPTPGFPPKSTAYDYFQSWARRRTFQQLLLAARKSLRESGRLQRDQGFIDAPFAPAKNGGEGVGLTRKGKGTKIQVIVDSQGLPLGASVASADPGEPQMVQLTLDLMPAESTPERLVGDNACDSDPLDAALAEWGIEMIAPRRSNRKPERRTQDGRKLKRSKRRWVVERTIAWLQSYRRILVRYEKRLRLYQTFTLLACFMIVLKRVPLLAF